MTVQQPDFKAKRVLVVAPAWVGDMVMAEPVFSRLKALGAAHVAVLAPSWTRALTTRMPTVDSEIAADFAHGELALKSRYVLAKSIRDTFDIAVILPRSLKSALIPFFAGIKTRIGYVGECRFGLLTHAYRLDKTLLPLTRDRFLYLVDKEKPQQPSNPVLIADKTNAWRLLADNGILFSDNDSGQNINNFKSTDSGQKILILCPGAEYGPSKQWSLSRFAAIANLAKQAGATVIALGSAKDQAIIQTIQNQASNVISLAGKTSITDAIDLLAIADAVLCNDSGLMHIAAAVQVPLLAIYGSTTPNMTPPLCAHAKVLQTPLTCRPCFLRQCPKTGADYMRCMDSIHVEQVWQWLAPRLL